MECFIGISTTEKNRKKTKNYDDFYRLIANQLLYLAPWMNGNALSFWNVN